MLGLVQRLLPFPGLFELLSLLSERFSYWFDKWSASGLPPLRQAWLDHAFGLGEEIEVRSSPSETSGRFVDLDEDGALLLERRDGSRFRVTAGDVQLVGQS